ncbi:MAG: hypothetical protein QW474_03920 [Candidatus Aenigmatarchaeota archaeon]
MKKFDRILFFIAMYILSLYNSLFSQLFYLRPSLTLPILSQKIDIHAKNLENKDVKLLGGLGYSANIGVKIKGPICTEIGLGREFFSADIAGSTNYGEFSYSFIDYIIMFNFIPSYNEKHIPLISYLFKPFEKSESCSCCALGCLSWFFPVLAFEYSSPYFYFGIRQHMGTRLVRDLWPYSIHDYRYEDSIGYYLGIGARVGAYDKKEKMGGFLFFDFRYIFAKHKCKSKDIYYDKDYNKIVQFYDDWNEINGNNFVINVGFGFIF